MSFRKRIRAREQLIGTLVTLPCLETVEVLTGSGFDWLFLDLEHSAMTSRDTQLVLQAVGERTACLVRVESRDEPAIRKALDSGANGIVVPQVNTAVEAARVVALAKYPPEGTRGAGLGRAQGYGLAFQEYVAQANESVAVVIQIEHIEAVRNINEILRVPGIDAVFLGPYDLSGSLGKLNDPEVQAAITEVFEACAACGVISGAFAGTAAAARPFIEAGVTLIAVGSDAIFLGAMARKEAGELRKASLPDAA